MKLARDDLDRFMACGVHASARVIYFGGHADSDYGSDVEPGVGWSTSRRLICALAALDDLEGTRPITVIMNSGGGDWSYGMAIFDAIQACVAPVIVVNMSYASSMTSVILQAADLRITAPHSHYMIHDGYVAVSDTPRTAEATVAYDRHVAAPFMYETYLSRLTERGPDGLLKADPAEVAHIINSKLPSGARKVTPRFGPNLDHIVQLCGQDTYFTAEETVRLNFADRLLESGDLAGGYVNPSMLELPTGPSTL